MAEPNVLREQIKNYVDQIAELVSHLENLACAKEESVKVLQSEISKYETSLKLMEKAHEEAKSQTSRDLILFSTQIDEQMAEVKRLEYEVSGFVAKKGDLKLENIRLSEENRKFKEYELKSMKVLQAKETSLIEREEVLEQKEGLKPKSRTLLPPTE